MGVVVLCRLFDYYILVSINQSQSINVVACGVCDDSVMRLVSIELRPDSHPPPQIRQHPPPCRAAEPVQLEAAEQSCEETSGV